VELSVVLPCLNEAETLEVCIRKAQTSIARMEVHGEVIVADNGSTDGSQDIARRLGARSSTSPFAGTAPRCRAASRQPVADSSSWRTRRQLRPRGLEPFVAKLRQGFDLVMGNRFLGGIAPGAMPPLHRYLGNPVLTAVGRLFFRSPIRDFHCGMRGFRRDASSALGLRTTGMEFASEMVAKAALVGFG
jgi:glycosyltransferase involved in cell wall biosynthesis